MTTARPARPVRRIGIALAAAVLALAAPAAAPTVDLLHDRGHESSPVSAPAAPNGKDWGWE